MLKHVKKALRITYNQIDWFFYFFIKSPAFELYVKKQDKINRKYFYQVQEDIKICSDNYLKHHYAKELPQKIWIYWEQGESNAPLLVKKCIESWKRHNPNFDIVVLNKTTVSQLIEPPEISKSLPARYKADLYRLMLLNKYGGIWADATTYCHRPINDWLPLFFSNGFFMFSNPSDDRNIENWFIASTIHHPLISSWEYELKKYLFRKKLSSAYFIIFYLFQWMLIKDKKLNQLYRQSSSLNATPCFFMKSTLIKNTHLSELKSIINNGLPLSKLDWRLDLTSQELISLLDEIEKNSP
jgi:hypothetical protein